MDSDFQDIDSVDESLNLMSSELDGNLNPNTSDNENNSDENTPTPPFSDDSHISGPLKTIKLARTMGRSD